MRIKPLKLENLVIDASIQIAEELEIEELALDPLLVQLELPVVDDKWGLEEVQVVMDESAEFMVIVGDDKADTIVVEVAVVSTKENEVGLTRDWPEFRR